MTTMNPQSDDLDFLSIDTVSNLEEATSATGVSDPIRWKPSVSPKNPSYSAIIRLLPQGIEGVKNKTYPSVKVHYHHLKLNGVRMEVKCCRNTPGQDCPICRAVWDRYNELAKTYQKGSPQLKVWSDMGSRPEWYTNILVREDDNKSANNGKVLVWRHSDAMERTLRAPFDDSVDTEAKNANAAPARGALAKLKKEKRHFIPYSPANGVDFGVLVSWDAVKKMTSYDGSDYVSEASPLADTKDQMLEILDSCHDLKKYLADVPTEDEAATIWRQFMEKASTVSGNSAFNNQMEGAASAGFGSAQNPNYAAPRANKMSAADLLGDDVEAEAAKQEAEPVADPDADLVSFANEKKAPAATRPAARPATRTAPQTLANELPESEEDDDTAELPF